MKKIFLIGFMGSGKTTLGKKIASYSGLEFIDMDVYIEQKEQKSISQIFAQYGQEYFRKIERKALIELLKKNNVVVATGGGTPCFFDNMQLIKDSGAVTVYLEVSKEKLLGRLSSASSKRPLVANLSRDKLRLSINKNLDERISYYEKADFTLVSRESPNRDAETLIDLLNL